MLPQKELFPFLEQCRSLLQHVLQSIAPVKLRAPVSRGTDHGFFEHGTFHLITFYKWVTGLARMFHIWKEIKNCLSCYRWTKLGIDSYAAVLSLRLTPLVCQLLEISHEDSHSPNIFPGTCFERQMYNKCVIVNWTLPTAVKIEQTKHYLVPQFSKDTQNTPHLSLVIMILKKLTFLSQGCIFHFLEFPPPPKVSSSHFT